MQAEGTSCKELSDKEAKVGRCFLVGMAILSEDNDNFDNLKLNIEEENLGNKILLCMDVE